MIKTNSIIAFLLLGISLNVYADEADRIDQLEKEIQELQLRISKLESLLANSETVNEILSSNESYKSITNWRKLKTDMSYSDVRKILGEPQRIDGGSLAQWYYPNGGIVVFQRDKAWRWEEPQE